MSGSSPLTSVFLFGLRPGTLRWGLSQMAIAPPALAKAPGLRFGKLLGTGHGQGFSIRPNFHRYGLFCVWEHPEALQQFEAGSEWLQQYRAHVQEEFRVLLQPYQAHGLWDRQQPFVPLVSAPATDRPMAVLTRAAIRWKALPSFWRHVPAASAAVTDAPGLLASIGMGELPVVRQATFSIWQNEAQMKAYAYKQASHREVIKKTRSEKWYSEELFARFAVLEASGTWNGVQPLAGVA